MGRLDLPDVHRDEDDFYGSPVDSPCMAREAGDSIVLRATGELHSALVDTGCPDPKSHARSRATLGSTGRPL
jgi:hypothetical protein